MRDYGGKKLSTYRAKRDFGMTAEPSGQSDVPPAERLRFVIQKHDATRLHYDFRLEWEGVFKSWAVTRGPSLDPHDKRLAVEVEDHPLDYGDFEGSIPKGQYGGGTVMLWDRGYWAPDAGMTVEQGLAKGDLKIVMDGERLNGGWVLVRIKNDKAAGHGRNARTNWLLIKHKDGTEHDGDADALLTANETSVASGRSMAQIAGGAAPGPTPFITAPAGRPGKRSAAKRVWNSNRGDPEASAEAVAQATFPLNGGRVGDGGHLPTPSGKAKRGGKLPPNPGPSPTRGEGSAAPPPFVEPQLTRSVDRPPQSEDWVHEIKFDGYRMQLRVEAGQATLKTRKGLDWTARFPEIAAESATLSPCILDGEIVALDQNGSPDFAGLQAALSADKTGELIYFVFDAMFAGGEDLRALPLTERKRRLQELVDDRALSKIRYVEHFENGGDAVLKSACSMHLEGIVSKRLDAPYQSGRGESWTKAKCRGGQEVVIAGWTSEGANEFRSLIAAVYRDGVLVPVGRIGTGFGRDKAGVLLPRLKALQVDKSPFQGKDPPSGGVTVHWMRPELVAEIESAGWTGGGQIRQASFKGLREDKPAVEVVEEAPTPVEAVEQELAAKPAARAEPTAKPAPKAGGNVVMGVTISSPDKVLWPETDREPAFTKLDLARYLEAVGPAIMPHIQGRPCSIIRAPDGIGGETFFQRHAGAGHVEPRCIRLVERAAGIKQAVSSSSTGWRRWRRWPRPSGLWSCTPGTALPGRPEVAGRLVFDLDPAPDVGVRRR